jgi:hypothetical protein
MILVRDIFQLHFGKSREALELMKEGRALEIEMGYPVKRVLADLTGPYYTVVSESLFESLADFERAATNFSPEWRAWYGRFTPLVREGRREIFRVIE